MVEGSSPAQLLQRFQQVQSRRAALYSRFDAGFRRYLETRQEGIYRKLMAELTAEFSDCSREVILLEGALRDGRGRADLAGLLRGVQEQEREKLRLTLALQALRGAYERKEFSWQHQEQPPQKHGAALAGAVAAASTNTAAITTGAAGLSLAHGPAHGSHGHGAGACGCGAAPDAAPEPTEVEYNAAVSEAIRSLQQVVVSINDLLEEVRYELADMPAGQQQEGEEQ